MFYWAIPTQVGRVPLISYISWRCYKAIKVVNETFFLIEYAIRVKFYDRNALYHRVPRSLLNFFSYHAKL